MRVENNFSVFAGERTAAQRNEEASGKNQKSQGKSNTIFAGGLNMNQDRIEAKRQQAQKQALKVVTDAWSGDQAIDEDLKERREHISALSKENSVAKKELSRLEEEQNALKDTYEIADDSKEQKDLELLKKSRSLDTAASLTDEEREYVAELKKQGLTEYQERYLKLDEQTDVYRKTIEDKEKAIMEENAIIRGVHTERLKHDPMLDASKQAEAIEEAASKEIVGMLMEDAKDHIDEEQKEQTEKAEEIKEKKEEEEELLEARKEEKEKNEVSGELPEQEILAQENTGEAVKQEIQNIVNKMNLVTEDIKGSMVDQTV